MPLFGSKKETVATHPAPVQTHHNTRTSTSSRTSPRHSSGGLFSRRRSNSSVSSSDIETSHRKSGGGLFSRSSRHEDPSIAEARNRVLAAEQAERDADHALQMARVSVRDAREHVRRLELEAQAEAKAAKLKAGQAKDLGRRAKPLGRHDRF